MTPFSNQIADNLTDTQPITSPLPGDTASLLSVSHITAPSDANHNYYYGLNSLLDDDLEYNKRLDYPIKALNDTMMNNKGLSSSIICSA